jgi:TatA/E family protein of Tat protein translocase
MFGSIGGSEFLLIAVLALLLFGPRKLPQIGKSLGRALGEFRRATYDFKRGLEHEVEAEGLREAGQTLRVAGREVTETLAQAAAPAVARGALADRGPEDDAAPAPPAPTGAPDGETTPPG